MLCLQRLLKEKCTVDEKLFASFLNRLFNTLNWTITEFAVVITEMQEQIDQHQVFPLLHTDFCTFSDYCCVCMKDAIWKVDNNVFFPVCRCKICSKENAPLCLSYHAIWKEYWNFSLRSCQWPSYKDPRWISPDSVSWLSLYLITQPAALMPFTLTGMLVVGVHTLGAHALLFFCWATCWEENWGIWGLTLLKNGCRKSRSWTDR